MPESEAEELDIMQQLDEPQDVNDCQINELIGTRVANMTDAELEAFIVKTRAAIETPATLKKLCTLNGDKPKTKPKAKLDANFLASLID